MCEKNQRRTLLCLKIHQTQVTLITHLIQAQEMQAIQEAATHLTTLATHQTQAQEMQAIQEAHTTHPITHLTTHQRIVQRIHQRILQTVLSHQITKTSWI